MVKHSICPFDGVVADLASLGEAGLDVVRILGVVVLGQVARNTRRVTQFVVIVDVAVAACARWNGMGTG